MASAADRFVVTGPTGWIGAAMIAALADRLGPDWRERTTLFASSARGHVAPDGAPVPLRALDTITPADVDGALVVHLAYLGKEKADELSERAFTDTNLAIDDSLLDVLAQAKPKALFVASSGAAQLAESGRDRHPYGLGKLRQEARFLGWGARSGVPVLSGRIFNVAGPHVNKVESYAISSFLLQARRQRRVEVAARVPVFRSFLHVDDLCALVLGALDRGLGRPAPVDLCGAEVLEMGDIAEAAARLVGEDVGVVRGAVDHARPSLYLGDYTQTKLLAMQQDRALASFAQQMADTDLAVARLIGANGSQERWSSAA